jgi:hypothetical protein
MKRYVVLLMSIALFLSPFAARAQQGQGDTLVIPVNQHVAGDVATVERNIRVDGVVDGDVTSWSGSITIAGSVGGDVVSYGGAVTITATGRVGGHVLASGGVLQLAAGAVVAGQMIRAEGGGGALASLLDLLTPAPNIAAGGAIGQVLFGAAIGVLLLAFCLLYMAFWPRRTAVASATLQRLPGRALALGLLTTTMLALLVLPVAGLLMASVIGLPLLIVLFVVAQVLYIYGMATFVRFVAMWKAPMHQPEVDVRTIAIALGLVLLIAICTALMPLWGLALFYLLASPGLGAAILSRGGLALPASARS